MMGRGTQGEAAGKEEPGVLDSRWGGLSLFLP